MSDKMLHLDCQARFGAFTLALNQALPVQGVTGIFGPSGSGKSSLLRLIAGFEPPSSGIIKMGETVWTQAQPRIFIAPEKRAIGYVFQGGRLFPHFSVAGNLDYGHKRARARNAAYSYDDVIAAFDLAPLLARRPGTLSGGERQRVALAQALLTRPRLLLLDEPLSALDQQRKQEILPYLVRLQSQFGLPMLYVSHDINEMARISDHVLMLDGGRAKACGETVETLNEHGFQTDGTGRSGTLLNGKITRFDARFGLMEIAVGEGVLKVPADHARAVGETVRVVLNASEIALSVRVPEGISIQNILRGRIKAIHAWPEHPVASVSVTIGSSETCDISVQVTRAAIADLALATGAEVFALIKTASLAG